MLFRLLILTALLLNSVFLGAAAVAQVNGPGPSEPNDFDTVINLPSDQPTIDGSIGNTDNAPTPTTQLNVSDGGTVGDSFVAYSGSEVNIEGGIVGERFRAGSGSEVNISAGIVGDSFNAWGSTVNISGGNFGRFFDANLTSEVAISGGSFGPNFRAFSSSSPRSGSGIELIGGEFMLDDMPFTDSKITFSPGSLTGTLADGSSFIFNRQAGDILIGVTLTPAPLPSVDTTPQVVNSDITASTPSGLRSGQTMTLRTGGVLGENFAVVDATLNIEGGDVGEGMEIARSVVNISDGSVGEFQAHSGSKVTISGGSGARFRAYDSSEVNITGGSEIDFSAFRGSVVNITGGSVIDRISASDGSVVNISGGSVGDFFEARTGSVVNISGGRVGEWFSARSVVNISGGEFGNRFDAYADSVVNISGGDLPDGFNALSGSEININGGTVGNDFDALPGSVVNIRGGSVGEDFFAFNNSEVNLFGSEFFVDGVPLNTLVQEEPFIITNREGQLLSGTLVDGSPFRFVLDDSRLGEDFFSVDMQLTVTLVPEPCSVVLLIIASGRLLAQRRPRGTPECSQG